MVQRTKRTGWCPGQNESWTKKSRADAHKCTSRWKVQKWLVVLVDWGRRERLVYLPRCRKLAIRMMMRQRSSSLNQDQWWTRDSPEWSSWWSQYLTMYKVNQSWARVIFTDRCDCRSRTCSRWMLVKQSNANASNSIGSRYSRYKLASLEAESNWRVFRRFSLVFVCDPLIHGKVSKC